jgi:hypothetical protein
MWCGGWRRRRQRLQTRHMREILQQVCYDSGRLIHARHALYPGDPHWVTAVELTFESSVVSFHAVAADDTLAVALGPLVTERDETIVPANESAPWTMCLGRSVIWAWVLTNQQGYTDGVRLEFRSQEPVGPVVELVVLASQIRLLVAAEAAPG